MVKNHSYSFEDISNELSPQLFAYLRRMSGNSADADDLLQETLLKIAHGLPQFDHRSSIKNWAYKIATNVAIDSFRKTKKATFIEFDETINLPEADNEEDKLVIDEMNDCVRKVIYDLPPDYRAVLILFSLQGKSLAETAKICGISVSSAKVRIHRAKMRLKEALVKKCDFYQSPEGTLRCDKKRP